LFFGHLRFSFGAFVAIFCSVKTENPLHDEAVSGLEIRFRRLLRDSDRSSTLAVRGTTTRRTERGLGAAIHDGKSYIDMDAGAKGKIHRRWRTKSNGLAALFCAPPGRFVAC
jgi:hypothetical protein